MTDIDWSKYDGLEVNRPEGLKEVDTCASCTHVLTVEDGRFCTKQFPEEAKVDYDTKVEFLDRNDDYGLLRVMSTEWCPQFEV